MSETPSGVGTLYCRHSCIFLHSPQVFSSYGMNLLSVLLKERRRRLAHHTAQALISTLGWLVHLESQAHLRYKGLFSYNRAGKRIGGRYD